MTQLNFKSSLYLNNTMFGQVSIFGVWWIEPIFPTDKFSSSTVKVTAVKQCYLSNAKIYEYEIGKAFSECLLNNKFMLLTSQLAAKSSYEEVKLHLCSEQEENSSGS